MEVLQLEIHGTCLLFSFPCINFNLISHSQLSLPLQDLERKIRPEMMILWHLCTFLFFSLLDIIRYGTYDWFYTMSQFWLLFAYILFLLRM